MTLPVHPDTRADHWRAILEALAVDDPYVYGEEYGVWCFWCEQEDDEPHSDDCEWLTARTALTRPLTTPTQDRRAWEKANPVFGPPAPLTELELAIRRYADTWARTDQQLRNPMPVRAGGTVLVTRELLDDCAPAPDGEQP